jgi:alpha-D-ribose 1-methylphosphonate 5-triphosphate diphosphatase PhnM
MLSAQDWRLSTISSVSAQYPAPCAPAHRPTVEIRGKMDHDPNDKEFSRMGVLKDHYSSKKSEASSRASTIATKRQSRFNMVPKRESLILPDVGYEKGWIKRQAEREELVGQGEGWKSSA